MTKLKKLDRLRASLGCGSKKSTISPAPDSREKILRIATELFAEHGLDGVSVRDISDNAEVNVSLISYYFGGKEALYMTIIEEHTTAVRSFMTETMEQFRRLPASRENFAGQVRAIITHCVQMRVESPALTRLIQRERLNGLPYARKIVEGLIEQIAGQTLELVENGKAKGILRKDLNARAFFITVSESIFGYFTFQDCLPKFLHDAYKLPEDHKEYIDFLVRLYTEGVYK